MDTDFRRFANAKGTVKRKGCAIHAANLKLAKGLLAALDKTNSQKGK